MNVKVVAKLNNVRISSRKVRLVVDKIRGLSVSESLVFLNFNLKKPSDLVYKLVNSAVANAENNFKLDKNNLYISEITVNEGRTLKRWRPRAYGRAYKILKRTSNINLVLSSTEGGGFKKDNN